MHIKIEKDRYGSCFAIQEFTTLFQFEWRKDDKSWYFWLRGQFDPEIIPGREFPMSFFLDACRAKSFIKCSTELDEDVVIVSGFNFIKK